MEDLYYIIASPSSVSKGSYSFLWVINGDHMFQGNIYDATKFERKELAEKRIELLKEVMKTEHEYVIVTASRLIFEPQPKNVIDFEQGYVRSEELDNYSLTVKEREYVKRVYSEYHKNYFENLDIPIALAKRRLKHDSEKLRKLLNET